MVFLRPHQSGSDHFLVDLTGYEMRYRERVGKCDEDTEGCTSYRSQYAGKKFAVFDLVGFLIVGTGQKNREYV